MGKTIKRGAIAGIIALIAGFLSFILQFVLAAGGLLLVDAIVSLILSSVIYVCSILFFYGFIEVGRRGNVKLLKVVSYIFFVLSIIVLVISIISNIYLVYLAATDPLMYETKFSPVLNQTDGSFDSSGLNAAAVFGGIFAIMLGILFVAILIFISIIILMTLFGVGLLKLGDELPIAKATGTIKIVGAGMLATLFLFFIAIPVLVVAYVMEIILLFQASRKYERGRVKTVKVAVRTSRKKK